MPLAVAAAFYDLQVAEHHHVLRQLLVQRHPGNQTRVDDDGIFVTSGGEAASGSETQPAERVGKGEPLEPLELVLCHLVDPCPAFEVDLVAAVGHSG